MNTAAIKAAIEGTDLITNAHLDFAKDKIMMGSERKSYIPSEESRKVSWRAHLYFAASFLCFFLFAVALRHFLSLRKTVISRDAD